MAYDYVLNVYEPQHQVRYDAIIRASASTAGTGEISEGHSTLEFTMKAPSCCIGMVIPLLAVLYNGITMGINSF